MRLSLVADHLQYAAMPGILALAAALWRARRPARAEAGRRRWPWESAWRRWPRSRSSAPASSAATSASGATTSEELHAGASLWCGPGHGVRQRGRAGRGDPSASISRWNWIRSTTTRGSTEASPARPPAGTPRPSRDYDQAIALKPDCAEAWFNRGNALSNTGRSEEALRDLDQAIALKPDYAEAYVNRGHIHAAAGRYDEAVRDYDRAIAAEPDSARPTSIAAWSSRPLAGPTRRCATTTGRRARSRLRRGVYNRGTAYARAGRLEEALRDLDEAIALKPDYAEAYVNRGNVYMAARRYDEAIGDYDKAIACDRTMPTPGTIAPTLTWPPTGRRRRSATWTG